MNIEFARSKKKPSKGMFVALHNIFPPETKGTLGVIIDLKKDPLGFNYGVLEFHDNKVYYHHISTIIPLKDKWTKSK